MFPIVITKRLTGKNATNWPFLVVLNKELEFPAAIAAQEIWESRHKTNPVNLVKVLSSKNKRREMEYMGHEVEVAAAVELYGEDERSYRRMEAEMLQRGYKGLFDHLTVEQIESEMKKRSREAKKWVAENIKTLRKHL